MKKRFHLTMLVALGAMVGGILVYVWRPAKEPVYEGQPISYWLDQQAQGKRMLDVYNAVKAVGVKAVPHIVARIKRETAPAKAIYRAVWPKMPSRMKRLLPKPANYGTWAQVAVRWIGPEAFPVLVPYLHNRNAAVRCFAISALQKITADEAKNFLPDFISALADPEWQVRGGAVEIVCPMGPVASNAVPALLTGVSDTRRSRDSAYKIEVQAMFTKALGKIGLQARATVPVLTQNLQHTNRSMRTQSAIALWRIDRQTTNTIPVLVGELNASGNPSEKRDLVECLGEMGPPAKSAVPQLAALALRADRLRGPASRFAFVDFDPTLVPVVLQALMRIDPATAAQMGIGVPEGEAGERVRFLRP